MYVERNLSLLIAILIMFLRRSCALQANRRQVFRSFPLTPLRLLSSTTLSNEKDVATSGLLKNFVSNIIEEDLSKGRNGGRVVTRFPPEPNGYLHLGHAKSVNFNFAIASVYGGITHMRFDDTNPAKEDMEYVRSILDDVRWLVTGDISAEPAPWHGPIRHASDYFQTLYDAAEYLIQQGHAYVDDLTPGMIPLCSFISNLSNIFIVFLNKIQIKFVNFVVH